MFRRKAFGIMFSVLMLCSLILVSDFHICSATGTVYIRADGSIDPVSANITSSDNSSYSFTGNISSSIVVQRSDIVIDGKNFALQGSGLSAGFSLVNVSNVVITNTKIVGFMDGIYLERSSDNKIYHNDFEGNTRNVNASLSNSSSWDDGYPSGGNYWSNYFGTDLYNGPDQDEVGPDGIGDTPYVIDSGNVDRYPNIMPHIIPRACVSLSPPQMMVHSGDTFAVDVNISAAADLYAYEFKLAWRFKTISLQSAVRPVGHFLEPVDPMNGFVPVWKINLTRDDTYQTAHFGYTLLAPESGRTGGGVLIRLTFTALARGFSPISFKTVKLANKMSTPIPTIALNSSIAVDLDPALFGWSFPLDRPWTVSQRLGGWNYTQQRYHLGEDVFRAFEAPVYSPANGVVKHSAKHTGYGYVVIIEHELLDGTFVCSVLGHLRENGRVPVGSQVTQGQIVGYLSCKSEENGGIIHVHYGIRKGVYSEELDPDGEWRYRGYGPIDIAGLWCPPSAFIDYYNLHKETPPSYSLTLDTEGGGAFTTSSASVYTLVYMTVLTLISSHPWWERWSGTDGDNINPTTVTIDGIKNVIAHLCEFPVPSFIWPVPSVGKEGLTSDYGRYVLSEKYGEYRYHTGIDIVASVADTPVVAVANGKVVEIVRAETNHTHQMENVVVIEHNLPAGHVSGKTKVYTLYAHMVSIRDGLKVGDDVLGDYEIGKIYGTIERKSPLESGTVTRHHLHFEIKDEPTLGRSWTILGPAWTEYGWADLYLHNPRGYPSGSILMYWGYTRYHPDSYGYNDPMLFFHAPRNIDPTIVRVNTDTLHVRRGPSTEYPIQTTVQLGQEFLALKKSTETTGDWYQIWRREFQVGNRGSGLFEDTPEGWVFAALVEVQTQMKITEECPMELVVVDPDGIIITKDESEVPGMFYMELDINGDGEPDDIVIVPEPKAGDYLITVIPELGASPTRAFTLEASAKGTTLLLADHAQISEIPTDPYVITSNETSIMLRNINAAITHITPCKSVVGKGYSLPINVTVQNQGTLEETFNFTLYVNTTAIASQTITLASGEYTTIAGMWNTSSFAMGNYTIWAHVSPVPYETYTADNTMNEGWISISILGDLNADGTVDIFDIATVALAFSSTPNDPNWIPVADVNGDGIVDIFDIVVVALHFGETV